MPLVTSTRTENYQKADGSSGYDAVNRLVSVDYGDGQTQSYGFDAMGNRLSRADSVAGTTNSAYNAADMLLSAGGTSAWDSQNRLVSCIGRSKAMVQGGAAFGGPAGRRPSPLPGGMIPA